MTRMFKTTLTSSTIHSNNIVKVNKESNKPVAQFSQEQTYTDWAYIS